MDQIKIGRFIAERRKAAGLTQMQLAELLGITDRAVSKWETGRAMPDTSIMLELCKALKITVNDLLCGEVVTMENYNKNLENNLLEAMKQKERADRRLLVMEIVIGVILLAVLLALVAVAYLIPMEEWQQILLVLIGLAPLLIATPFMLKIEQTAGYYKCKKCAHTYVPTYTSVFIAPHVNRTRYMKCAECGKWAWHKKVLTKENDGEKTE